MDVELLGGPRDGLRTTFIGPEYRTPLASDRSFGLREPSIPAMEPAYRVGIYRARRRGDGELVYVWEPTHEVQTLYP